MFIVSFLSVDAKSDKCERKCFFGKHFSKIFTAKGFQDNVMFDKQIRKLCFSEIQHVSKVGSRKRKRELTEIL